MVLIVVLLHILDWDWFVTQRAQLDMTNTVALMKVKGAHIDGPFAGGAQVS